MYQTLTLTYVESDFEKQKLIPIPLPNFELMIAVKTWMLPLEMMRQFSFSEKNKFSHHLLKPPNGGFFYL
ncbi:hypothetical protein EMIT036CA2_10289 [Chryseobacterium sp. IT-36CA2]